MLKETTNEKSPRLFNPLFQIRRLYNWTMKWADHPKAPIALGVLSTIEGIFFPVPVDPFLLAMSADQPKKSLKFAAIASAASILGGSIGFFLGAWFWSVISDTFFEYFISADKFAIVEEQLQNNGFSAIFLASFTPIPYKVFAIAAGAFKVSYFVFLTASILGRSLRFFTIGTLFFFWGAPIKIYLEKHFDKITLILGALCVGFFIYIKL